MARLRIEDEIAPPRSPAAPRLLGGPFGKRILVSQPELQRGGPLCADRFRHRQDVIHRHDLRAPQDRIHKHSTREDCRDQNLSPRPQKDHHRNDHDRNDQRAKAVGKRQHNEKIKRGEDPVTGALALEQPLLPQGEGRRHGHGKDDCKPQAMQKEDDGAKAAIAHVLQELMREESVEGHVQLRAHPDFEQRRQGIEHHRQHQCLEQHHMAFHRCKVPLRKQEGQQAEDEPPDDRDGIIGPQRRQDQRAILQDFGIGKDRDERRCQHHQHQHGNGKWHLQAKGIRNAIDPCPSRRRGAHPKNDHQHDTERCQALLVDGRNCRKVNSSARRQKQIAPKDRPDDRLVERQPAKQQVDDQRPTEQDGKGKSIGHRAGRPAIWQF